MAKRRLKTFDLDQELLHKLLQNNFKTVEDVISQPPFQLMIHLSLSFTEAESLIMKLSDACLPNCFTASELLLKESDSYIEFGDKSFDEILRGGLKRGVLTEIAGPSGVGKTQMCLHLSLKCIQTKQPNAVAFIDTEGSFRSERILEMLEANSDVDVEEVLNKLHIFKPTSVASLSEIFQNLELFCIDKGVGLVVIDSVASLARKEFSYQSTVERSKILASWASQLKALAHQLNIAALVTNQVTSKLIEESENIDKDDADLQCSSVYGVKPALGNTWTHFVNTRLILQYIDSTTRQIIIAKSPIAPMATKNYSIKSHGIKFVGETCYTFDCIDPNNHQIKVAPGIPIQ